MGPADLPVGSDHSVFELKWALRPDRSLDGLRHECPVIGGDVGLQPAAPWFGCRFDRMIAETNVP